MELESSSELLSYLESVFMIAQMKTCLLCKWVCVCVSFLLVIRGNEAPWRCEMHIVDDTDDDQDYGTQGYVDSDWPRLWL